MSQLPFRIAGRAKFNTRPAPYVVHPVTHAHKPSLLDIPLWLVAAVVFAAVFALGLAL